MLKALLLLVATGCATGGLALGQGDAPVAKSGVVGGAESGAAAALAPAAGRQVDFKQDIKPILESSCVKCHAHGQKKSGLQIDSRDLLLKGGESGPAAAPGHSAESLMIKLVAGLDPDRVMPQRGPRLTPIQIGLLRAWIDQGMPWEAGVKLGRGAQAALPPRRPKLPEVQGVSNPVDRWLDPYFTQHGWRPPAVVEDRVFARRVYLDTIGLLPTPQELAAFQGDRHPNKRQRLVHRLLSDHQRYAEHWLTFWNDALRNDYKGTGYIDGGRKQITPWLYGALATNLPFDRFVARLVNPDEHSEGFTRGIVWRGVVNASQKPELQAAQNLSQVFLGINLKCASCHDSFISDWKLADAYGLASIYAEEPLELVRCDKPQGQTATRKFLYPQLGSVMDSTNRAARLASLAGVITSPADGRLTRTIVNRLWAKFMGRGLVEPVDEMDNPPWNADLLDWLAVDLVDHGYDLKHTIELILTSQAYQLPAVGAVELTQDNYVFHGPFVRRLTAEEYLDALAEVTGQWHTLPANEAIDFTAGKSKLDHAPRAKWIWVTPHADQAAPPQTIYLRKTMVLPEKPSEASAVVTADNRFTLYLNGHEIGSSDKWDPARVIDLKPHLVQGTNVFAVQAVNDAKSKEDQSPNPAGFFFEARLRADGGRGGARSRRWDFGSDRSWLGTTNKVAGWQKTSFNPVGWRRAVVLGDRGIAPWNMGHKLLGSWACAGQYGRVRASLVATDPLMTALGRPTREQVVTTRAAAATTLQALEITNGTTLAEWLKSGAKRLLAPTKNSERGILENLYVKALGRPPSATELQLAEDVVGQPAKPEGVEDLLWAVSLLPEFQLIY